MAGYDERSFLEKVYAARGQLTLFNRATRNDTAALKRLQGDPEYKDIRQQAVECWLNAEVVENGR